MFGFKNWSSQLRLPLFFALIALAGCNYAQEICSLEGGCGAPAPPVDQPGTFSYYAFTQFNNAPGGNFCSYASETWCALDIQNNFASQLKTDGWTNNPSYSIFDLNGVGGSPSQDPTATTVINDKSNLMLIDTHGSIVNGSAQICLYNCNGAQFGNDYSVGPSDMPSAWNGPNWLVLWACGVVQTSVGWEGLFGGSLHGILGFGSDVGDMTDAEQSKFTALVSGYDSALDAWSQTGNIEGNISFMTALVPTANKADAIEASGGPHFGPNGQTSPQYYAYTASTGLSVQTPSTLASSPSNTVSLTPEVMNESYWYNYYGGSFQYE